MLNENLNIREANCEDAQAILDYMKLITRETNNLLLTPEIVDKLSLADEKKVLKDSLQSENSIFLVAEKDNLIIGTGNLHSFEKESFKHRGTFGMAVRKEFWGKGIGSLILKGLIDFANSLNLEILELEVRTDNHAAIHLYQKIGFTEYGMYKEYMLINNVYYDVLLMSMKIKS